NRARNRAPGAAILLLLPLKVANHHLAHAVLALRNGHGADAVLTRDQFDPWEMRFESDSDEVLDLVRTDVTALAVETIELLGKDVVLSKQVLGLVLEALELPLPAQDVLRVLGDQALFLLDG